MTGKILEILNVLDKGADSRELSLYEGIGGEILFRSICSKTDIPQMQETTDQLLERLVNEVADFGNKPAFTFAGGISGNAWLFHYLQKKGFIELNESFFDEIDELLFNVAIQYLNNKDYDILHGACGIMICLLNRPEKNHKNLELLAKLLLEARIDFKGFKMWEYRAIDKVPGENKINMGLAHGMPAVMVVMSKLYKANVLPQEMEEAIDECYRFIKSNENSNITAESFSHYPTFISDAEDNEYHARMAWCYGDPGLALAMYVTGKNTDDTRLTDEAINIFTYYASFTDHPKLLVRDAAFCHGSAGLAHMFNRMYYNTRQEIFKTAANYWCKVLQEMAWHIDGLAGYKTREEKGWVDRHGLLEGITGIGLVMSSFLIDEDPDWDECFFLS